ncbi:putative methyltransferase DDB_G0268948 [Trichomycterus rosablanca]|uniref:putative methyltransferase DDB_G0268948 n=1 Tax=Trichomycterus rosablanca TaxID=2290929 RepID=UPI002F358247
MTHRLFEEKHHASIYQKYRISPPDKLKELILEYLDNKKGPPYELAVDLGCGTGQNTRLLACHFKKIVGLDVSENQLEEARAVPGFENVTYRSGSAEELPFPDGSVDLLTAASAAHWFDPERFLNEATRVLKPCGCIALLGYTDQFSLRYGSCGDELDKIFAEVKNVARLYASSNVAVANSKLQDLFEAIPFSDKKRLENIPLKMEMTVAGVVGFVESFSYYQTYFRKDPQAATSLLDSAMKRALEKMGVSSPDTELEFTIDFYCVLACKEQ